MTRPGSPLEAEPTGRAPLGTRLYKQRDGTPILLKRKDADRDRRAVDRCVSSCRRRASPAVSVKLDSRGGDQQCARRARTSTGRWQSSSSRRSTSLAHARRPRGRRRPLEGGGHQRRDHPRRVLQQFPDHRPVGSGGHQAREAAAGGRAGRADRHRRAARDRPERRRGRRLRRRAARAPDRRCSRCDRIHGHCTTRCSA